MHDPEHQPEPATPTERLIYLFFLVLILGLFAGEVFWNHQPVKLSALFFVVAWVPLLALHEGSHALMATLLNWRVAGVVLGVGKTIDVIRIGRVPVEFRLFPVEGFVRTAPCDLRYPRLKSALIYFAGPGSELLLAGLLLWAVGPERLFSRSENIVLIFWQSCALAATVGGVVNLIPHGVQTPRGLLANDGLGLITSFTMPIEHYQRMLVEDEVWRQEDDRWPSD